MSILGFFKEYRFLSNFHPSTVTLDGIEYKSVEHAYQAAKTFDAAKREQIRLSVNMSQAKMLGQLVDLRPDWEEVKLEIMESLVREKFTRHKSLKQQLLATGDVYLEETNNWGDRFYGVVNGTGLNHL